MLNDFRYHLFELGHFQDVVNSPVAVVVGSIRIFLQEKAHNECCQITRHKAIVSVFILQKIINLCDGYSVTGSKGILNQLIDFYLDF